MAKKENVREKTKKLHIAVNVYLIFRKFNII